MTLPGFPCADGFSAGANALLGLAIYRFADSKEEQFLTRALAVFKSNSFFPATLVAVGVSFVFRVCAVRDHWPSIVPVEVPPPAGHGARA